MGSRESPKKAVNVDYVSSVLTSLNHSLNLECAYLDSPLSKEVKCYVFILM